VFTLCSHLLISRRLFHRDASVLEVQDIFLQAAWQREHVRRHEVYTIWAIRQKRYNVTIILCLCILEHILWFILDSVMQGVMTLDLTKILSDKCYSLKSSFADKPKIMKVFKKRKIFNRKIRVAINIDNSLSFVLFNRSLVLYDHNRRSIWTKNSKRPSRCKNQSLYLFYKVT